LLKNKNPFYYRLGSSATFLFLNNHREYFEKARKPILKVKYKDMEEKKTDLGKKGKKIDLLQQTTKRLPKIFYYITI